jgi:two-component system sensor histidine kinase KdpD
VGKTYAMLEEGHRLQETGRRVLVGVVEDHGRSDVRALVEGLDVVPRRVARHRGVELTEMDLDAILRAAPEVALVDELAHTNAPGSRHRKRWQDVRDLLDAGIDVISTINIQHIESLTDVVEAVTGVPQRETVPDRVVRGADQVELVDLPTDVLRERLSEGKVYPPERIDAALANFFRVGNLTALRELALLWLADDVDGALRDYRREHDIDGPWETRERVVVALAGGPEGDILLRRGARIIARSGGGELVAVHVVSPDGLRVSEPGRLTRQRELVEKLGGTYSQVIDEDVPGALLAFARSAEATQLVIGTTRRGWVSQMLGGPGVAFEVIRAAGPIDVHIVNHRAAGEHPRLPRMHGALSWKRRLAGFLLTLIACPALTWGLTAMRGTETLTTSALSYQLLVVIVALVGGVWPALLAAVASGLALDYFLIPPLHTATIGDPVHVLSVVLFILVGLLVSYVVDRSARRARIAQRATAESDVLSSVAGSVLREQDALHALVSTMRETFGLSAVRLLATPAPPKPPTVLAADGELGPPGERRRVAVDDTTALEFSGPELDASEQRLLSVIVTQIRTTLEHRDLEDRAQEVGPLEEANKVRSALLSAVGHDVRRPLAAATAAVSGLQTMRDQLSPADREELLSVVAKGLDDLTGLVTDLLDISRVQAGVFPVAVKPMDPAEVVLPALEELGLGPGDVELDLASDLPGVRADPALLRRVLVNLLANARRFSGPGHPVRLAISSFAGAVEIRVVDHGPGLPVDRRDEVFLPFQRLGDTDNTTGLGLGLALSRGFTEGMGGSLRAEDTPGGGLTMVVSLPCAGAPAAPSPPPAAASPAGAFRMARTRARGPAARGDREGTEERGSEEGR